MTGKKLPRDADMLIASERIKQLHDELVAAGFTSDQALNYIATLVAKIASSK